MRVTTGFLVNQSVDRLQARLASFEAAQDRLSTGRNFQTASEDLNGMNTALALRSSRRSTDQAVRNAQDGATRIDLADTKLQQGLDTLRRVRELMIRGANSLQSTEATVIAGEIESLRDQLVDLANADYLGHGLFAGTAEGNAISLVAGVWTYEGDGGAVNRRISETEVVDVNVTGDEVFGFAGPEDVFSMLDRVSGLVTAQDAAGLGVAIADVDAAMDRIHVGLSELGARGSRIESTIQRGLTDSETVRRQLSNLEDVDLAEAVYEIQTEEVALQATMGAVARALQPSLLDYLR